MVTKIRYVVLCVAALLAVHLTEAEETAEKQLVQRFAITTQCPVGDGQVVFYGCPRPTAVGSVGHFYHHDVRNGTTGRLLADEEELPFRPDSVRYLSYFSATRTLAFVAPDSECQKSANKIWLLNMDSRRVSCLVANGRDNSWPEFSPDGSRIAFYHAPADWVSHTHETGNWGWALSFVRVETGEITQLAPEDTVHGPPLSPPSWSPDGRRIAYYARYDPKVGTHVYVVDVKEGRPTALTAGLAAVCATPVWVDRDCVLYNGYGKGQARSGVYEIRPDGSGNRLLFPYTLLHHRMLLSPSRKQIAIVPSLESIAFTSEVVVIDLSGKRVSGAESDIFLSQWLR